ncbi:MAG: hypothetical protein HQL59_13335 [Magnetococcales bacterium]|nr:hypothetical protein [Magnetococcales bacterium]
MAKFTNDQPTLEIDALGYAPFAHQALTLIREVDPPFSLTIGGRWGAGKTSILQYLKNEIDDHPEVTKGGTDNAGSGSSGKRKAPGKSVSSGMVRAVWFNPWQYQGEANPMVPLLHEIRAQLSLLGGRLDLTGQAKVAFEAALGGFGHLADLAAGLILGVRSTAGKGIVSALEGAEERRLRATFSAPVEAERFQQQFEKAIKGVVNPGDEEKSKGARLVIFIDDLDRCDDRAVFALLEAIKLYLSSDFCVFVFALDRIHVERAVAAVGNYAPAEAADYVEKLFQARLHLPHPATEHLEEFLGCLLRGADFPESFAASSVLPLLPANPRSIKTFINSLTAIKPLLEVGLDLGKTEVAGRVVVVHWLRVFAPDIYELLVTGGEFVEEAIGGLADRVSKGSNEISGSEKIKDLLVEYCRELETADVSADLPDNALRSFFHRNLETPLLSSGPVTGGPEGKAEDERYHRLRARLWKEGAIKRFRARFFAAFQFSAGSIAIRPYLI